MRERLPPPSPENNFNGRLSGGIIGMMNFEAALLGYKPPLAEEDFNEDDSIELARKINKYHENFEAIFTEPHFSAAAFPNLIPLVRVCLLTAPQVVMNDIQGRTGTSRFRPEFSAYNEALRDAIRANPAMTKEALVALLEGGASWAKIPESYLAQAGIMYDRLISGATGEITAEQLLGSGVVKEANITYERSSVADDLNGVDFIVTHPAANSPLMVDIKNSPEQVQRFGIIDSSRPLYRINGNNKVMLYAGAGDALQRGQLQLDQEHIEPKGAALVATLDKIADRITTKDAEEMPELLAKLAMMYPGNS